MGEHPLFSPVDGWVQAKTLAKGDALVTHDGTEVTVVSNTLDLTPSLVYNLEVADAHTYFVGDFDVWSHNAASSTSGNSSAAQRGKQKHSQLCNFMGGGWLTEFPIAGGRADVVNMCNKVVVELKPCEKRKRDYTQLKKICLRSREKIRWKMDGRDDEV